jgi:tRNA A37 methylthiotransferase MiaB
MNSAVPQHVARFRSKALRKLIVGKNESFRRKMIGRELEALTLTSGEAISNNFIKIYSSQEWMPNQWISVFPPALRADGLAADFRSRL